MLGFTPHQLNNAELKLVALLYLARETDKVVHGSIYNVGITVVYTSNNVCKIKYDNVSGAQDVDLTNVSIDVISSCLEKILKLSDNKSLGDMGDSIESVLSTNEKIRLIQEYKFFLQGTGVAEWIDTSGIDSVREIFMTVEKCNLVQDLVRYAHILTVDIDSIRRFDITMTMNTLYPIEVSLANK